MNNERRCSDCADAKHTGFFFTNLHETKIISLRNSDNFENEKKKLKQKINFHKTDKLKEFFNHKLIIILIFLKRIKLETFVLTLSVSADPDSSFRGGPTFLRFFI